MILCRRSIGQQTDFGTPLDPTSNSRHKHSPALWSPDELIRLDPMVSQPTEPDVPLRSRSENSRHKDSPVMQSPDK